MVAKPLEILCTEKAYFTNKVFIFLCGFLHRFIWHFDMMFYMNLDTILRDVQHFHSWKIYLHIEGRNNEWTWPRKGVQEEKRWRLDYPLY